jgi:hypothetical protein
MSNTMLPTAANTPSELRAVARDLIARADTLEAQALQKSGTPFWDIPSYASDAEGGILIEQHEPGWPVQYRLMDKTDRNSVGSEWDSNEGEPKKNHIYPPKFVFKCIAEVSLLSTLTDDAGNELRRYIEA